MVTAADFVYLRRNKLPTLGAVAYGLAHDAANNVYYTIEKGGLPPCAIAKITIPSSGEGDATVVSRSSDITLADWGWTGAQLPRMKGLLYDPDLDILWVSGGVYYASGVNWPTLMAYDYNADAIVGGPWKVDPAVHMDTVKGNVKFAPASIKALNGYDFIMFGTKGSTSQGQSWGIGLVSVEKPALSKPTTETLAGERLIHWPMIDVDDAHIHYESNFPRGVGGDKYIRGNEECRPSVGLDSYEFNDIRDITENVFSQNDSVYLVEVIDDSLLWTGDIYRGYSWYGNQDSHRDPSAAGVTYDNYLDGLFYPGTPCNGFETARGRHGEASESRWYLQTIDEVITQYGLSNKQVGWASTGALKTFGGSVPFTSTITNGILFEPSTGLLRIVSESQYPTKSYVYTFAVNTEIPDPPPEPGGAFGAIRLQRPGFAYT